jgi:cell division protein FtsQ
VAERRPRADAVAATAADVLPLRGAGDRARRENRLPTTRSLVVGFALVALAVGAYLAARETSAFAVRSIAVEGAPSDVATRIRSSLSSLVGTSLVSFDRAEAARRVLGLPEIASASFDRDFPHTLRVAVSLERSAAVLRQGELAWVASTDARVLHALTARPYPPLPRVWLPRSVDVVVGSTLEGHPAEAVRAVAPLAVLRSPLPVNTVRAGDGELTLVLRSGMEVRLGNAGDLRLKLAVARRIVPFAVGARYVDVSVPERAVAGFDSQVGG